MRLFTERRQLPSIEDMRRAFQALWVELQFEMKSNIICGVIYRQHNSPESFQTYFDETLEKLSNSGKPIYVLGDFKVPITPKYFFCLNKSLHLFETHCAFLN